MDKLSAFHISQPGSTPGGSPLQHASKSPAGSIHSKTSATEESELDHVEDPTGEKKTKKRRWRMSSSTAKPQSEKRSGTPLGSRLGSSAVAERSATSLLSHEKPGKSITKESDQTQPSTESSGPVGLYHSSNESTPLKDKEVGKEKDSGPEDKERKGPVSWIKGKVAKAKEERKEREAEKERAKSPPRSGGDHATSKQSLGGAIAQDNNMKPAQGRSTDAPVAEEGTVFPPKEDRSGKE